MTISSSSSSHSESFYHKAIKQLVFKIVREKDGRIIESSLEKCFNNRRADVYFKFKDGKQVIVEVQHSKISVKEIIERTREYNRLNIHVLWILHGNGACVASQKHSRDVREVKISPVENFLHEMYGGRVYYVNVKEDAGRLSITPPFALYFSLPSKKKKHGPFKEKYWIYYIRNAHFTKIPSWNLSITKYRGFKIARFYDKSVKARLQGDILKYIKNRLNKRCKNCMIHLKRVRRCCIDQNCRSQPYMSKKRIIKQVLREYKSKYGKYLVLEAISRLIAQKRLIFND